MDIEENHLASLFDNGKIKPIDYIKDNTNYLSKFNEEDIKDIKADCHNKLYILLKNGDLYFENEIIKDINYLYQMDYLEIFAITNDKKIICLNNEKFQEYFNDIRYDKVITYLFGIVALYKGEVKIALNYEVSSCINFQNFMNVEDIGVDDNDNEVYVKKNGKWIKLFIN